MLKDQEFATSPLVIVDLIHNPYPPKVQVRQNRYPKKHNKILGLWILNQVQDDKVLYINGVTIGLNATGVV